MEIACHTTAWMVAKKARAMEPEVLGHHKGLVAERVPALVAFQAGRVVPDSVEQNAIANQRLPAAGTLLQRYTLAVRPPPHTPHRALLKRLRHRPKLWWRVELAAAAAALTEEQRHRQYHPHTLNPSAAAFVWLQDSAVGRQYHQK